MSLDTSTQEYPIARPPSQSSTVLGSKETVVGSNESELRISQYFQHTENCKRYFSSREKTIKYDVTQQCWSPTNHAYEVE